jgi:hypothetical protein
MEDKKLKLDDMKELLCSCGHNRFKQQFTMREISPIFTGKDKPIIQPIALIVCDKCEKVFEAPQIIT